MDLLKKIWDEVDNSRGTENIHNHFSERYIFTTNSITEEQFEEESDFMAVILSDREEAFKLGFRTAIELIFFSNHNEAAQTHFPK